MEKQGGIYQIKNIINNEIYIGSAVNFSRRWQEHKKLLKRGIHANKHIQNAWNKYGEDGFVFEIIEKILEKSNLIEKEQHYLDTLNPEYNICKTAGSTLGQKPFLGFRHLKKSIQKMKKPKSKEHKEKISKSLKNRVISEKHKQKISETKIRNGESVGEKNPMYGKHLYGELNGFFGKHHSKKSLEKMSISAKKRFEKTRNPKAKLTEDQVKEIRKLRNDGKKLKEISFLFNISTGNVSDICLKKIYKDIY